MTIYSLTMYDTSVFRSPTKTCVLAVCVWFGLPCSKTVPCCMLISYVCSCFNLPDIIPSIVPDPYQIIYAHRYPSTPLAPKRRTGTDPCLRSTSACQLLLRQCQEGPGRMLQNVYVCACMYAQIQVCVCVCGCVHMCVGVHVWVCSVWKDGCRKMLDLKRANTGRAQGVSR